MNGLPELTGELRALADALDGRKPPCMTDPELWFEGSPDAAIRACREMCHARLECSAYAESVRPSDGVWGGRNFTRKTKTPRRTA